MFRIENVTASGSAGAAADPFRPHREQRFGDGGRDVDGVGLLVFGHHAAVRGRFGRSDLVRPLLPSFGRPGLPAEREKPVGFLSKLNRPDSGEDRDEEGRGDRAH